MKSRYNLQVVRIDMTTTHMMVKIFKYLMLAIITGCCVQSAPEPDLVQLVPQESDC